MVQIAPGNLSVPILRKSTKRGELTLRKALAIDDALKVVTTTAGMLSGIVGAVVGFYFRSDDK